MKYPEIINEEATLRLMLMGHSIARFGDGEWRCAVGGGCTSQRPDPQLAKELQAVLKCTAERFLVGLPNPFDKRGAPRKESWIRYTEPQFTKLLRPGPYHSSFISRPDNAPWIDTPGYWAQVRQLWSDVAITLVVGAAADGNGAEKKSVTQEMIGARSPWVRVIIGPRQHAYEDIDRIEKEIGNEPGRVLLCLGVTATVLAYRLAKRGIHALDLGHIGMFLRHAGAYRYSQDAVASPEYRALLTTMHKSQSWGNAGKSHAPQVEALAAAIDAKTILDYGCGTGSLSVAMKPRRVSNYDPGIPASALMPKPCELVVCTDVLEHIEPAKLDAVLDHIFNLTGKAAYMVISTRPAKAILPDGRNAHICLREAPWWLQKLRAQGWDVRRSEERKGLTVWAYK